MSSLQEFDADNVHALRLAYERLLAACDTACDAIMADGTRNPSYPVCAPTFGDSFSGQRGLEARIALVATIRSMFGAKEDVNVLSGIICASPDTVAHIHTLNKAKLDVKNIVAKIKKDSIPCDEIDAEDDASNHPAFNGFRCAALRNAMKITGFAAVDLKRVYAQIRILEPCVRHVGWTWAINHSTFKTISRESLDASLRSLDKSHPDAAYAARLALKGRKDNRFVIRKKLPPQLRMNYSYNTDNGLAKKSGPVSGVLIAQQETLPTYKWREPEDVAVVSSPRGNTSKVADAPLIKILGLYCYE